MFEQTARPEVVVITDPNAQLRASPAGMRALAMPAPDALNAVLAQFGAQLTPMFGATEERVRSLTAPSVDGVPLALDSYYSVQYPDASQAEALAAALRAAPGVLSAYVKPPAEPPIWRHDLDLAAPPNSADTPPVTPNYLARQAYLDTPPGGIGALQVANRLGAGGSGVRVIDIEGAWRFSHEDLLQNQGGVVGGVAINDIGWRDHGTAVVGVIGADSNTIGVRGIAPDAIVRAVSFRRGDQQFSSAEAIRQAADALSAGDILLIELHRPGPRHNFQSRLDQAGYIAIEWWPDDFAALAYASSRGVIVVEASGNGAENLDDPIYTQRPVNFPTNWQNPFNRSNPQCGALLVGAGAPPPGTHGRDHGPDRSRLEFSNFGACVDVQGWGREVTTTGYGDLQGGSSEDLWYTDQFSGTSSASPIVVGALAVTQGALRAASRPLLNPASARTLLRSTGSPQQDAPNRPATQRIGNRPNLVQIFAQLLPSKSPLKDVRDGHKDLKERLKEGRKEIKDPKELKEIQKDGRKELLKEGRKEIKEPKEFKELREDLKPHDGFVPAAPDGGQDAGAALGAPDLGVEASKSKDFKDFKDGRKELKDKDFKDISKDLKDKDLKDGNKDLKEKDLKDGGKDLKDKDFKDGGKDLKDKDFKDNKEIREDKLREDWRFDPFERLQLLEEQLGELRHFIGRELRPDLVAKTLDATNVDSEADAAAAEKHAYDNSKLRDG